MRKLLPFLIILMTAAACKKEEAPALPHLVVEGWIESGGHPVVMLSESIGLVSSKEMNVQDMMNHIAKWAKVTVSDGEESVVLTGMLDADYFPPYIYTTGKMTGEAGRSYTLMVEYKDYVASATTTIPQPVPLDTVYVKEVGTDSTATVMCGFTDPPVPGNYYKIFTRTVGRDQHYHPSSLACASDDVMDGYTEMFLYSTVRLMDRVDFPNIKEGDELWVKLCTMNRESFEWWNKFEVKLANTAFNLNPRTTDSASNLTGALGYWAGYGVAGEKFLKIERPSSSSAPAE